MTNPSRDYSSILYEGQAAAEEEAKVVLRQQNKMEWVCDIMTIGNPRMNAGTTFIIEGFGVYDGKYIADTVTHDVSMGYVTKIKGHRVLKGY